MKRAYKELLEECQKVMESKEAYKTLYSLDGEMIETMDDLKSFCLDDGIKEKRMVTVKLSMATQNLSPLRSEIESSA
jgi:hypothetical protein